MMERTLVFSALFTIVIGAVLLPSLACSSGAPREEESAATSKTPPVEGKATAPGERTPPPAETRAPAESPAAANPAEAAVPSSGPTETSPAAPSSVPERIVPATRRSAAGLPDPVTGYISWFRLGPSPAPEQAAGAHAPARQAYVLFTKQEDHTLGGTVRPPFDKGTLIVLEEKEPGKDFISRVRTMTVEETGWKFAEYARDAGDGAFATRTGAEAACAACHAKAKDSDSVYSNPKLE